jgi:drug/metabolite transporter (DMT)-like permease
MTPAAIAQRNRTRIILAFAAVYVLWGSTYLFIRYAIDTIPPFVLGTTRFIASGVALYALARWRGAPKANSAELRLAALTGVLMLGIGNGAVMWAEKTIPSGVVALIVSSVPIWVVLMDWLRPNGTRPRRSMFLGLAVGFIGMVILIGPRAIVGQGHVDEIAAGVLLAGSVSWAFGTLLTRWSTRPGSPLVFAALQMLAAAGAMFVGSLLMGEWSTFTWSAVSPRSMIAFVYLVIFGSIIGYTAYVYLLGVVSAAKAATYAYVNPVIAVILGWAFANEPLGWRTVLAAAVILGGVAIITTAQARPGATTGEHPLPTPSNSPKDPQRSAA